MSDAIRLHEGDKEVYGFEVYDSISGDPIAVDDVTAATFVVVFTTGTEIECTLGDGITSAVSGGGVLTVTVTVSTTRTETVGAGVTRTIGKETIVRGTYQLRVTRGTIGPETIAEGNVSGVVKAEGD